MIKFKVGDHVQVKCFSSGWMDAEVSAIKISYKIKSKHNGQHLGVWEENNIRKAPRTITKMMQAWVYIRGDQEEVEIRDVKIFMAPPWEKVGEPYSKTLEIPE